VRKEKKGDRRRWQQEWSQGPWRRDVGWRSPMIRGAITWWHHVSL